MFRSVARRAYYQLDHHRKFGSDFFLLFRGNQKQIASIVTISIVSTVFDPGGNSRFIIPVNLSPSDLIAPFKSQGKLYFYGSLIFFVLVLLIKSNFCKHANSTTKTRQNHIQHSFFYLKNCKLIINIFSFHSKLSFKSMSRQQMM